MAITRQLSILYLIRLLLIINIVLLPARACLAVEYYSSISVRVLVASKITTTGPIASRSKERVAAAVLVLAKTTSVYIKERAVAVLTLNYLLTFLITDKYFWLSTVNIELYFLLEA